MMNPLRPAVKSLEGQLELIDKMASFVIWAIGFRTALKGGAVAAENVTFTNKKAPPAAG